MGVLTQTKSFNDNFKISEKEIRCIEKNIKSSKVTGNLHTISFNSLQSLIYENLQLIKSFNDQMLNWTSTYYPFLIFLTDSNGIVMSYEANEEGKYEAEESGFNIGTVLAPDYAGINSSSLSLMLLRPILLKGKHNSIDFFKSYDSFGLPIRNHEEKVVGSLNYYGSITFPRDIYILLRFITTSIEKELLYLNSEGNMTIDRTIYSRLSSFPLTKREQEISKYWVLDYNYKQISRLLNISENTVRVYIANIYGKLQVSSKAQMILKILV